MNACLQRFSLAVITAIAAISLSGCDSAPTDPVVRLERVFAERPAVADADNAFLDVFGFAGLAGVDPHELGLKRVAWLEKLGADPASAGSDPGIPGLRMPDHRTQQLSQVIEACRAAMARACDSALERVRGEAALSDIEPLLLARYEVLLGRGGWRNTGTTFPGAPMPSYDGTIEAQRLMLIRLRNAAAAGDVEKVRAMLSRDLAYWRRVLVSSDFLISKMMALAAVRQHFAFGSYVLRDLPAEKVLEAIPAQWRVEFSDAERSLLLPLAGEVVLAQALLRVGRMPGTGAFANDEGSEAKIPFDGTLNRAMTRKSQPPKVSAVADYFLTAAEGFQAPLPGYEAASQKLRRKYSSSDAVWNLSQYALRVGSAEGMRRAALLTAELRSESVPVVDLARRLENSPLRNPYTGQPFEWDAADHAIVFTGPEERKYKRQAYPY